MNRAEVVFEKLALKMPNKKIMRWTTNQLKLYDIGKIVVPLEEGAKKVEWKPLKDLLNNIAVSTANRDLSRVAGTIRKGPDKKTFVVLNTDIFNKYPRAGRRAIIAHEMFHAKAPEMLGFSELYAHVYGGLKSKAGLFSEFGPLDQYIHYLKTRPLLAAAEHGIIGGAMYGGSKLIKDLKTKNKGVL